MLGSERIDHAYAADRELVAIQHKLIHATARDVPQRSCTRAHVVRPPLTNFVLIQHKVFPHAPLAAPECIEAVATSSATRILKGSCPLPSQFSPTTTPARRR